MASLPTTDRLALIDLLRFVAALSVLVFHYAFRGEHGGYVPPLHLASALTDVASYAGMGVYLFFVISGFVIAYSAEGRSAWAFAASRFARLYPTYLLCMTVTALVLAYTGRTGPEQGITLLQYASNLLMFPKLLRQTMVDGVYWSIQYEVIFYGWVFLLMLLGLFGRFTHAIVAIWLIIAALNVWVVHSYALSVVFLTQYAGLFATGIMLFRLRRYGASPGNVGFLLVAIVVGALACDQEVREAMAYHGGTYSALAVAVVMAAIFGLMLVATQAAGAWPWAGAMAALGALTYPLYLLHQMIGYTIISALVSFLGSGAAMGITTAGMLALAALVHWGFERWAVPATRIWAERLLGRVGAV